MRPNRYHSPYTTRRSPRGVRRSANYLISLALGDRVLRSRTPELVKQEIWSLLLVHYAIRHVMKDAADTVGTDPDDLSFIRSSRAIRRQVPNQAGFSP